MVLISVAENIAKLTGCCFRIMLTRLGMEEWNARDQSDKPSGNGCSIIRELKL